MAVTAVLWGGPEDGKVMQLADLCFELELTALGTPLAELPEHVVPTYWVKYERSRVRDSQGHLIYQYVRTSM